MPHWFGVAYQTTSQMNGRECKTVALKPLVMVYQETHYLRLPSIGKRQRWQNWSKFCSLRIPQILSLLSPQITDHRRWNSDLPRIKISIPKSKTERLMQYFIPRALLTFKQEVIFLNILILYQFVCILKNDPVKLLYIFKKISYF